MIWFLDCVTPHGPKALQVYADTATEARRIGIHELEPYGSPSMIVAMTSSAEANGTQSARCNNGAAGCRAKLHSLPCMAATRRRDRSSR